MTTPLLRRLERQLAKAGAVMPDAGISNGVLKAIQAAAKADADEAVEEAREAQERAEERVVELNREVAKLHEAHKQLQKDMQRKMEETHSAHKAECNAMCERHDREMQKVRNEVTLLRQELASEQQARARAEAQLDAAKSTQVHMERAMEKLKTNVQVAAPAVTVQSAPNKGAEVRVTQRDGNGRIVALSITPSS